MLLWLYTLSFPPYFFHTPGMDLFLMSLHHMGARERTTNPLRRTETISLQRG